METKVLRKQSDRDRAVASRSEDEEEIQVARKADPRLSRERRSIPSRPRRRGECRRQGHPPENATGRPRSGDCGWLIRDLQPQRRTPGPPWGKTESSARRTEPRGVVRGEGDEKKSQRIRPVDSRQRTRPLLQPCCRRSRRRGTPGPEVSPRRWPDVRLERILGPRERDGVRAWTGYACDPPKTTNAPVPGTRRGAACQREALLAEGAGARMTVPQAGPSSGRCREGDMSLRFFLAVFREGGGHTLDHTGDSIQKVVEVIERREARALAQRQGDFRQGERAEHQARNGSESGRVLRRASRSAR